MVTYPLMVKLLLRNLINILYQLLKIYMWITTMLILHLIMKYYTLPTQGI